MTRKDTVCIFWTTLVLLQNVTIPGENGPQGRAYSSLRHFHTRGVNAFCRFVNPVLALARSKLSPAALGAERSSGPASIKPISTTLSDPTPMASRRYDSRVEIRGDNYDTPLHT